MENSNIVTYFFFYMWNHWCEEECKIVFKDDYYPHFWDKWCEACRGHETPRGASEIFYSQLSETNREKIVNRTCEYYAKKSF